MVCPQWQMNTPTRGDSSAVSRSQWYSWRWIKLPRALIYPIALGAEAWARISGREPFVTVDGLKMSAKHMFFTSAKAERELGYRHRPARAAITDAVAWFRATGRLPAPKLLN